ncbi:MAG: ArgE/DapE family deacylase [Lactobacillus sp.]|jgi:succinyl-diaminopimelate desuccinylase|nr:ArgE/DapE family deacylase [Lactobacillus sp.]
MTVITEAEQLKILKDLVAIPSVNDQEQAVAEYLQKLLAKHNIAAKLVQLSPGRASLVAEIGAGKPIFAVSGHLDVVAPGELDQWATDPFTLTEKAGKLYGRGASDMKSGLAAIVIALIEIQDQHLLKKGTIRLLATAGEEIGEPGAIQLYQAGYLDDVDALLIGEPSGYNITYAHKGPLNIRITSKGEAAHSSRPQLGYNAIDPLIEVLHNANREFRSLTQTDDTLGKVIFNATVIHSGDQVNTIPALAYALVNVRATPAFTNQQVIDLLQQLLKAQNDQGARLSLTVEMSLEPVKAPKDSRLAQLAVEIGKPYAKTDIPLQATAGGTDASNFLKDKPASFPFIVFGPGNLSSHKANEYVDQDMYLNFVKLYQQLFSTYVNEAKDDTLN